LKRSLRAPGLGSLPQDLIQEQELNTNHAQGPLAGPPGLGLGRMTEATGLVWLRGCLRLLKAPVDRCQ